MCPLRLVFFLGHVLMQGGIGLTMPSSTLQHKVVSARPPSECHTRIVWGLRSTYLT